MHRLSTAFILGYHGCPQEIAEELLAGKPFRQSENDYDWLGPGIYLWESNPARALHFASEKRLRKDASWQPAVVGVVADLGFCLDLATESGIAQAKAAHSTLLGISTRSGRGPPENRGGSDRLMRRLDCAVIQMLHRIRRECGEEPFDTVRGIFLEGQPIYETAGFFEKTHVQICVRNPRQIHGVFLVPPADFGF